MTMNGNRFRSSTSTCTETASTPSNDPACTTHPIRPASAAGAGCTWRAKVTGTVDADSSKRPGHGVASPLDALSVSRSVGSYGVV